MIRKSVIFLFFALILAIPRPAEAAIMVTTDMGLGADSYIQSSTRFNNDAADTNYGSNTEILIKHDTGLPGNNRKGYMRFDTGLISAPYDSIFLELIYYRG
jgi:hypothetical protein